MPPGQQRKRRRGEAKPLLRVMERLGGQAGIRPGSLPVPGGVLFGDPQAGVLPLHVCVPRVTGHQAGSPGASLSPAALR